MPSSGPQSEVHQRSGHAARRNPIRAADAKLSASSRSSSAGIRRGIEVSGKPAATATCRQARSIGGSAGLTLRTSSRPAKMEPSISANAERSASGWRARCTAARSESSRSAATSSAARATNASSAPSPASAARASKGSITRAKASDASATSAAMPAESGSGTTDARPSGTATIVTRSSASLEDIPGSSPPAVTVPRNTRRPGRPSSPRDAAKTLTIPDATACARCSRPRSR